MNLNRYAGMFCQAELDGEPFEWPQKVLPLVAPVLPDFSCFSPLARDAINSSPPWKKKRTSHPCGRYNFLISCRLKKKTRAIFR